MAIETDDAIAAGVGAAAGAGVGGFIGVTGAATAASVLQLRHWGLREQGQLRQLPLWRVRVVAL